MSIQKLNLRWCQKRQFEGTGSNGKKVLLDGPIEAGGENQGIRPMEMVLLGLAGCSAFDVVSILEKKRTGLSQCEVEIEAQRADQIPAVFTQIHLRFLVSGEKLTTKAVTQAVELSVDKYCSVAAMLLAADVKITHSFEIIS
ncbi:OsmC family protein [Catenovulum adriaticum]|uniref:OsmC family protein n=1 Tax=Catenovulum adriaticum TaxID=2984846 RepID=A0ABY7AJG0_9ALTE|nr:OsmC family protein [Catenovulum sp. TS8]WAJ69725.1 OsmC family protein [Catenovulum sp. TS8]